MHFNPYFSRTVYSAKVRIGIKMNALNLCFISAAFFRPFIAVLTNTKNFKFFLHLYNSIHLVILFIKALQHKCRRSVGHQVLQPAKDGKLGQYV